ncbi:MAG: FtsQ-type POTRA domain-containing protein [Clostridia bacterium]|nr:FtsQ-type POTRA domain-containing protein [Clostridia bacterium]
MEHTENVISKAELKKRRRKNRVKRRLSVLLFLVFCIGSILVILKAPMFNIVSISCVGENIVKENDILKKAELNIGKNIFSTNMSNAVDRIKTIPYISEAKIKRIFPNKLEISIVESVPVFSIEENSKLYVLDIEGKLLEIKRPEDKQNLIQVVGITADKLKLGENIATKSEGKADDLLELVGILEKKEMLKGVTKLDLEDVTNIKIDIENRIFIDFGINEDMEHKIVFLNKIISENIGTTEKVRIDMRGEKTYVSAIK